MIEDLEEHKIKNYLSSDKFRSDFKKQVIKDTWEKGLPMIYMKDGKIIKHYKDGKIEVIKDIYE